MNNNMGFTPLERDKIISDNFVITGIRTIEKSSALTGFTLIETVVYTALFVIIMSGIFISAYHVLDANTVTAQQTMIGGEGEFVMRKIEWVVKGATGVSSPDANTLQIAKPGQLLTLVYEPNNKQLFLSENNGTPVSLTSTNVILESIEASQFFTVEPLANNKPGVVRVHFRMRAVSRYQDFSNTVYTF